MSGHSYHDQQQRKTRKNMFKIIIITTAIGAVAALGTFLFDALWLFRWWGPNYKHSVIDCFLISVKLKDHGKV